jgi:hypothetical protein
MLYRVIHTEEPRINNYKSYNNLPMRRECGQYGNMGYRICWHWFLWRCRITTLHVRDVCFWHGVYCGWEWRYWVFFFLFCCKWNAHDTSRCLLNYWIFVFVYLCGVHPVALYYMYTSQIYLQSQLRFFCVYFILSVSQHVSAPRAILRWN